MQEKRIIWKKELLKAGISAYNQDDIFLGWLLLENIGKHRHWCWYQEKDIRMSPGCLQEVRDKQKELRRPGKH